MDDDDHGDHEKVDAVDLLEECWFFQNLFHGRRKPKMSRCFSDPCPSSNFGQEMLVRNVPNLNPHCAGRKELEESREKEVSGKGLGKLSRQLSHQTLLQTPTQRQPCTGKKEGPGCNLVRTPSLPPRIDVHQEKESDPRLRKFSQHPSANPSVDLLPPRHSSKDIIHRSNIRGYPPPKNLSAGSIDSNGLKEMRHRYLNQVKMKKSLTDLEIEEVQGFKDLGFTFEEEDLNPNVVNILPGLKEKEAADKEIRRPYLSEAWLVQSCAPPTPNWAAKNSAEDMKAQIKFWARAVASDVRLEC